MKNKEEIKNNIKSVPYINKVIFFNKISLIINSILTISKIILAIIFKDLFIGLASCYYFFIVCDKLCFYYGKKKENKKLEDSKLFLLMTIFLFIGSLFYLAYWVNALVGESINIKYSKLQFIIYFIIYIIETIFSIRGLSFFNKNKDMLLGGIKFVNLSISISAFFNLIIIILCTFKGLSNYYFINFNGVIIAIIMYIIYFKKYRKPKK